MKKFQNQTEIHEEINGPQSLPTPKSDSDKDNNEDAGVNKEWQFGLTEYADTVGPQGKYLFQLNCSWSEIEFNLIVRPELLD